MNWIITAIFFASRPARFWRVSIEAKNALQQTVLPEVVLWLDGETCVDFLTEFQKQTFLRKEIRVRVASLDEQLEGIDEL